MKPTALLFALPLVALVGCSQPPLPMHRTNGNGPGPINLPGPAAAGDKGLVFDAHKVTDPGQGNMVAYTYYMPTGWVAEDKIQWTTFGKLPYPAVQLVVHTPDKSYGMASYPQVVGSWSSSPAGQTGKAYRNGSEAVDQILGSAPTLRDYRVIDEDNQAVASSYPAIQGSQPSADVTIKHISVTEDGVRKEGIIIAKFDSTRSQDPYSQAQLWYLSVQAIMAPEGQLTNNPQFIKQATIFLKTASITPEYNQLINKVSFDASQTARKASLQQGELIMKNYWEHQKNDYKGVENFDQYIRGTGSFTPPGGGPPMTLPANGNYWMNSNGQLYQAPDGNTDPNKADPNDPNRMDPNNVDPTQGGGGWQQMKPNLGG